MKEIETDEIKEFSIDLPDSITINMVAVSDFHPWHFLVPETLKKSGKVYKIIKHPNSKCFRVYTLPELVEEIKELCKEVERINRPANFD